MLSYIAQRIEFQASNPTGELHGDGRDDRPCADKDTNAEAVAVVGVGVSVDGASVDQHSFTAEAVASTEVDEREPLCETPAKKQRNSNSLFAAFLKGARA